MTSTATNQNAAGFYAKGNGEILIKGTTTADADYIKFSSSGLDIKTATFDLSTTNLTTIYTVPSNRTAIVKSIQINNDDASAIQTEISVTDSSASTTYKIYHKDLAADTTDNGVVAPLVLESGDIVKIQVATANKIEGMISYLEIFDEKSA